MNHEKQRIKIAELLGWKYDENTFLWRHKDYSLGSRNVPHFCTDLNAMHEAEKVLTQTQRQDFVDAIARTYATDKYSVWFHLAHATAAQRAEAFLKTLNLWEDAP